MRSGFLLYSKKDSQSASNYMLELKDQLQQAIKDSLDNSLEMVAFGYVPHCDPMDPNSYPGITCRICKKDAKGPQEVMALFYAINEYPTIEDFCIGLQVDLLDIRLSQDFPELNIGGVSWSNKTISALTKMNVELKDGRKFAVPAPVEMPILNTCFDVEKGIFDVQKYAEARRNFVDQNAHVMVVLTARINNTLLQDRVLISQVVTRNVDISKVPAEIHSPVILDPAQFKRGPRPQ